MRTTRGLLTQRGKLRAATRQVQARRALRRFGDDSPDVQLVCRRRLIHAGSGVIDAWHVASWVLLKIGDLR
jgi:hypothetical protein